MEEKFEALKLLEPKKVDEPQSGCRTLPRNDVCFFCRWHLAGEMVANSKYTIIGYITITQKCWDGVALNHES